MEVNHLTVDMSDDGADEENNDDELYPNFVGGNSDSDSSETQVRSNYGRLR